MLVNLLIPAALFFFEVVEAKRKKPKIKSGSSGYQEEECFDDKGNRIECPKQQLSKTTVIIIICSILGALLLACCVVAFICRRRISKVLKGKKSKSKGITDEETGHVPLVQDKDAASTVGDHTHASTAPSHYHSPSIVSYNGEQTSAGNMYNTPYDLPVQKELAPYAPPSAPPANSYAPPTAPPPPQH